MEQGQKSKWIQSYQRSLRLKFGYIWDLCCHHFVAVVVDVVTELEKAADLSELLYSDDVVVMSEIIERLGKKLRN